MTVNTRAKMSKADARKLTQKIKTAVDDLWSLLVQAHNWKAWKALEYQTWEAYVSAEFNMSRQRSYQLIDQGKVIHAIAEAAGKMSTTVDISERDARDLKSDLPAVADQIKARVEAGTAPEKAIAETVAAKRADKEQAREAQQAKQAEHDRQRQEHVAALPQAIKDREAAKAEASAARKAKPVDLEALTAEIEELREANASLETELEQMKADHAKWEAMRVQFDLGGFEKIIADKDEEIRVLETRLYSESEDKASWVKSAKYWQAEAQKLGFSNDVVIDIETGEVVGG